MHSTPLLLSSAVTMSSQGELVVHRMGSLVGTYHFAKFI